MNSDIKKGADPSPLKKIINAPYFGSVIIVVIMLIVMLILKHDYLSSRNILILSKVLAVTAVIGFSQLIIIACGGLNLAIGSTGALSACLAALAMTRGLPWGVGLLIGLVTGIVCGLINGLLIYHAGGVGVAFFLTTLATTSVYQGIMMTITQGNGIYGPNGKFAPAFLALGNAKFLGLPTALWIAIVIAILLAILFARMPIGRRILAFGANNKAAELYGVSKREVVYVANIIAGLLASIAGILALIRIEAAQPNMGSDWMLMSFAAPLIGGTRHEGGKVSLLGAVLGALALTIITNALIHLRVDVYWNELIYGIIIILSVTLERVRYIKK